MTKNLVIVESPAKAKTINKYLGKDFIVMASIGHIKDLPSKGLGVDVQNNFQPEYEVIPDTKKRNNKKIVADLKKTAKTATAIYLAADPDRRLAVDGQRHAQNRIITRKAAIAALIDALVGEIQRREQTHDPAESLARDLMRAKAEGFQQVCCGRRYQAGEIFKRRFLFRYAFSDGCQRGVERDVEQPRLAKIPARGQNS